MSALIPRRRTTRVELCDPTSGSKNLTLAITDDSQTTNEHIYRLPEDTCI